MKNKKGIYNIAILIMLFITFLPTTASAEKLLAVHCDKKNAKGKCIDRKIMAHEFVNGVYTKSYVLFDKVSGVIRPGSHRPRSNNIKIVKDRYLISNNLIYDLEEREIIHNSVEYLHIYNPAEHIYGLILKVTDNQVIYTGRGEDKKDHIYIYDLDNRTYGQADIDEEKKWSLPTARRSPDGLSSYMAQKKSFFDSLFGTLNTTLVHHTFDGRKQVSKTIATIPFGWNWHDSIWLDNNRIIIPTSSGEIYILGMDGSKEFLVQIPRKTSSPRHDLYKSVSGAIYYNDNNKIYEIDVENKSFSEVKWHDYNNGFELENNSDTSQRKKIRYLNNEIGFDYYLEVTAAKGLIAVSYTDKPAMSVWSEETNSWKEIANEQDLTHHILLGWIQ